MSPVCSKLFIKGVLQIKKIIILILTAVFMLELGSCSGTNLDLTSTTPDEAANGTRKKTTSAGETVIMSATQTTAAATQSVTTARANKEWSTDTIEYSYGVAKDGKPHQTSVSNQLFFDSNGFNAVAYDNKTQSKVLYLTFDCGWENGYTIKVLDVLKEKSVPAAFFCTLDNIKAEHELIARMIAEGHIVGNHSDKHPSFSKITRERMIRELKNCDDYLRENFNYTSSFFRFPKGDYSEYALSVVQSQGYKSVFWSVSYADWDVNVQKGSEYAFSTVTSRLHPGAIILLHSVSPDNAAALGNIIDWARGQGYEFKPLSALPQ